MYRIRYIVRVSIMTISIDRSLSPNHFASIFGSHWWTSLWRLWRFLWCRESAGLWFESTMISDYMLHLLTGMFFSLVTFSFVLFLNLPHLDELRLQIVKHSGFCNADELANVHELFIRDTVYWRWRNSLTSTNC